MDITVRRTNVVACELRRYIAVHMLVSRRIAPVIDRFPEDPLGARPRSSGVTPWHDIHTMYYGSDDGVIYPV